LGNGILGLRVTSDVGFGSSAAARHRISSMAAIECKAVVQQTIFLSRILNVCFSQKRTFKLAKNHEIEGPLSARSGSTRSQDY
ncbi:MAG: hypothetical protein V3T19_11255, partial [Acidiferrobacterales bacterium]